MLTKLKKDGSQPANNTALLQELVHWSKICPPNTNKNNGKWQVNVNFQFSFRLIKITCDAISNNQKNAIIAKESARYLQ
jgi:hypothetical protein